MKKAVRITGGIWIAVCLVLAIVFVSLGATMLANADQIAQEALPQTQGVTLEQLKALTIATGTGFLGSGIYFAVGLVYTIVLMVIAGVQMPKAVGIVLGVIGVFAGAELPAIFFIIHAAKDL